MSILRVELLADKKLLPLSLLQKTTVIFLVTLILFFKKNLLIVLPLNNRVSNINYIGI